MGYRGCPLIRFLNSEIGLYWPEELRCLHAARGHAQSDICTILRSRMVTRNIGLSRNICLWFEAYGVGSREFTP